MLMLVAGKLHDRRITGMMKNSFEKSTTFRSYQKTAHRNEELVVKVTILKTKNVMNRNPNGLNYVMPTSRSKNLLFT